MQMLEPVVDDILKLKRGGRAVRIGGIDPGFISMAVLMVKTFELFKIPLLDNMYMMPLENPDTRLEDTQAILKQITPGITLFICHCTKPSPELPAITTDSLGRFADYRTWMNEDMRKFLKAEGIRDSLPVFVLKLRPGRPRLLRGKRFLNRLFA